MSTDEIDTILARQSVDLLEAMQRGEAGAAENLAKWLKQSRRHTEHYLMTVAFERELNQMKLDPQLDIESLSAPTNIVTLNRSPAAASQGAERKKVMFFSGRWRARQVAAALLTVSAAMLVGVYWQTHHNVYTTTVGEQRAVELEDGSVIHLNTQSRIAVHFSRQGRDIELLTGEALFKVHPDPTRPFRVHSSAAVIQAIGTEFNVYQQPERTTVAVLEGRVKIIRETHTTGGTAQTPERNTVETDLVSGQQVQIDTRGQIATSQTKDIANVAVWRQRRLIFAGTPLPKIVAEFNRYNRAPQFVLAVSDASERAYSGVFDADDPHSLALLLSREPELVIEDQGKEILIRTR